MEKVKVVISDCHLSAGRLFEGSLNPHEDFHSDEEMIDFFEYFSSGEYGEGPGGPIDVELILAGDYFDFLNVPVRGEFEDTITEEMALYKAEACIRGHPAVMEALKRFASRPGKRITYLVGNHDADLFFESVRERITREWDPEGRFPSARVRLVADADHLSFEGGVEIHHGNQFEAGSELSFERPLVKSYLEKPVLNLPWSSYYVLKIVNRLKWEREFIDKVRPVKALILLGLILDPWFTIRYVFLSVFYFLKTRFSPSPGAKRSRLRETAKILRQESRFFLDLEREAREFLDRRQEVRTLIFGHTHRPLNKVYPDGKQYINTGTWTKMINLDWRGLGYQAERTFALVRIRDGRAECDLRRWVGTSRPHARC